MAGFFPTNSDIPTGGKSRRILLIFNVCVSLPSDFAPFSVSVSSFASFSSFSSRSCLWKQ